MRLTSLVSRFGKVLLMAAIVAGLGLAYLVEAQSSGAPAVSVQVGDDGGCGTVGPLRTANPAPYPAENWSSLGGDGGNNKDFNCIKVGLAGGNITQDFRVGIRLSDDEGCSGNQITSPSWTPWASQGGGVGPRTTGDDFDNQNCAQIAIQTRPLVGGLRVRKAQIGVTVDNGSTAMSPWSSEGGGMSGWAVKTDVHWVKSRMEVELFDPSTLDADYVATTIPGTATPETTYGNVSITMKNTGSGLWYSTQEVSRTHECDSWNTANPPQEEGATCTFTRTLASPDKKLVRIDAVDAIELLDPRAAGSPVIREFRYERQVQVTYVSRRVTEQVCPETGGGPNVLSPGMRFFARLPFFGARIAHAAPIDPPNTPQNCQTLTYYMTEITETPQRLVANGTNATFPFKLRTSTPGEYDLRFRMADTSENPDFPFGETAEIHVSVAATSSLSLACQAQVQTVLAGGTAPYPLTVAAQNTSAPTPVTLSVSAGLPAGATAAPREVTVPANGQASAVLSVVTSAQTPVGTSTLTFSAAAPGMAPSTCTSQLVVRPNQSNAATLTVEPSSWEVAVGEMAFYQAWYDPDGFAGPASSTRVTADAEWAAFGQVASSTGSGGFVGVREGLTSVTAYYGGAQGGAQLRVRRTVSPVPTLRVTPSANQIGIGEMAAFQAWYDPDGGGLLEEFEVTGPAAWSITSAAASGQGNGTFLGMSEGSGTVRAQYNGLTGAALLTVVNGATFRVTPPWTQIGVGGTATLRAYYDPDGPPGDGYGEQPEQDVTSLAVWNAQANGVLRSNGGGSFSGLEPGTAGVVAGYAGMSDGANVIVAAPQSPTLRVEPRTRRIQTGQMTSFSAHYDPDGTGPQPERNVTASTTWSSDRPEVAVSLGEGSFRGIAAGSAGAIAAYNALTDAGTVTVTDEPACTDPPCGSSPTLLIMPDVRNVMLGASTAFDAWYDPDGTGPTPSALVTGSASWTADGGGVRSEGGGTYTGLAVGTTGIRASHLGATDSASVNVTPLAAGSCTFGATPATLFIPPLRPTTLAWSCSAPTTCTVTKVTGIQQQVASGGQSGSGQHSPAFTTDYRLQCANGVDQTVRVRVFDVNTRVEIIPR